MITHSCRAVRLACLLAAAVLPALAVTDHLSVTVDAKSGTYAISAPAFAAAVVTAQPAIHVDGRWVAGRDYPSCTFDHTTQQGPLGTAEEWTVHYAGLKNAPELLLHLRTYDSRPFGEIQLIANNTTAQPMHIEALRLIDAVGPQVIQLGGDAATDRILSDSFSEDRPGMELHDLKGAEKSLHLAVGSQLVYNQQSHQSWFIAALTSDKFLSVLRLHMAGEHTSSTVSYEVESTGTTELLKENSLQDSPVDDQVQLTLPVAPGATLSSERMLFSVSDDYHDQLETYGRLVRDLHHARVTAPTPLGWWSWTAFYFGLNQGTALTNAQWLAQNLKSYGYTFLHMDEGYQYARGEYATADAALFPDGVGALEKQVVGMGLTPGIWTAPFEVSERSWVFQNHPEWLVHNAKGAPIHLGMVTDGKDQLYALDTTHPDAQAYLRKTYTTLVNDWGIRYIKMDFMEDSAVEGYYHVPNTTALEAQRIGIKTVRDAVGEHVLLDKDGSELLNPVGLVDIGRISQDTGHTFSSSKEAAPGIAARYYMNRNYFIADPDAFTVSRQTDDDHKWHGGERNLTLDEAQVSIALTAVSGGMFEIGDDLPTLGLDGDRVALVKNRDILDIAELGHAATPIDLMSYAASDKQPSIFLLHEDPRQSIVTVFNWTETAQAHVLTRAALGLDARKEYSVVDVFARADKGSSIKDALHLSQPAHSVRMLKIVETQQRPLLPSVIVESANTGKAGETLMFSAVAADKAVPVLRVTWHFGDGVEAEGIRAPHAYTHSGTYTVQVQGVGIGGVVADQSFPVIVTGSVVTKFLPAQKRRLESGALPNEAR